MADYSGARGPTGTPRMTTQPSVLGGEGAAFFRWHARRWNRGVFNNHIEGNPTCCQKGWLSNQWVCYRIWTDHTRGRESR